MRAWTRGVITALTFAALPMAAQADTIRGVASYSHSQQWEVNWSGNLNGCDPTLLQAASGGGAVAMIVRVNGALYLGRTTSTWASQDGLGLSITGPGVTILPSGFLNSITYDDANALTCGPHALLLPSPPEPVPTLSEWAMVLLGAMLASGAALTLRRRRTA